jgi:hypothetical protein
MAVRWKVMSYSRNPYYLASSWPVIICSTPPKPFPLLRVSCYSVLQDNFNTIWYTLLSPQRHNFCVRHVLDLDNPGWPSKLDYVVTLMILEFRKCVVQILAVTLILTDIFHHFPWSLKKVCGMILVIRPSPLPSSSSTIHYWLISQSLCTTLSKLLTCHWTNYK